MNIQTQDNFNEFNDFIDYNINNKILNDINFNLDIIKKILDKTKQKDKTKKSTFFFNFVKKFSEQGVQGIVGVIILKKVIKPDMIENFSNSILSTQFINKCSSGNNSIISQYFTDIQTLVPDIFLIKYEHKCIDTNIIYNFIGYPLVFKLSVDISNMIQHEKNVAKELYNLHSYCPHFINILGDFTIPISNLFIGLSNNEEDLKIYRSENDNSDNDSPVGGPQRGTDSSDNDTDSSDNDTDSSDNDTDSSDNDSPVGGPQRGTDSSDNDSDDSEEEIDPELKKQIELELEKAKNLFYDTKDALPRTIILFEKINNFPFHRLLKKSNYDNNILSSQLLQITLALEIAQKEFKFTHYDLHTTNILEQHCEYNSVFLYNINNKKYIVPTYGYYPKIIDVGSSYSNTVKQHTMLTHANSYDYGFQSQFFDPLNDIHHSFLSLFYYIEDKKDCFDSLSNKFKHMFYRLPVLRKSGWKKLPHDLSDIVLYKIKKDCLPEYENYDIFREDKNNFLEIMNSLINIPFDKGLEQDLLNNLEKYENINDYIENHPKINFKIHFHPVMEQIKLMFNEEICMDEILFVLKELFFLILNYKNDIDNVRKLLPLKYNELEILNENYNSISKLTKNNNNKKLLNKYGNELNKIKKDIENLEKIYKKIKQELKEKTQSFIDSYIEYDIDYYKLVNGCIDTAYYIQFIYYLLSKEHQDIIFKSYQDTIIKSPIDMFEYISRNLTPSFEVNQNTILYYWDIDNKTKKKLLLKSYNNFDFNKFNLLPFNTKANYLYDYI